MNVTQKLIADHLVSGPLQAGREIALRIDQTLTQDATGTLVMLELEAMGIDRVATELSAQYVDHNLIEADHRNADDHLFLESACRRYGVWYSPAGNGVSHPVHMERFGTPGRTLLGSDSHTCAAGALGMLAIGAGGLEVALAMAGEPFHVVMPRVWNVRLVGALPEWVSAKDVILEMLRRHDVDGGVGYALEYTGPGLQALSAMDRHVIANMGAELGATTTVFPSDAEVRRFLATQGREETWVACVPDEDAEYDRVEEVDLSRLEPLIAKPSSPGNVVPVREVAGEPIYQAYIGSSANPGFRDFAVAAQMVRQRPVAPGVSFDVNPTSRQVLEALSGAGLLADLVHAGARLHQAGCNGCIGMGQAPASGRNSLRTVPRNFPGRSGTKEDAVFLCSPETATASALTGRITDPRELGIPCPRVERPETPPRSSHTFLAPLAPGRARQVELVEGPNIRKLPVLEPLPHDLDVEVLLVLGDDVSTDEILPAGARALPYRSNIPKIAEFAFEPFDERYAARATELARGHAVVGGDNYGQGSSREHAALAPRSLGLQLVLARSFARIHWQNLVNFGVLPLQFVRREDHERLQAGDHLRIPQVARALRSGRDITVENTSRAFSFPVRHTLSSRQLHAVVAGGLINWIRAQRAGQSSSAHDGP